MHGFRFNLIHADANGQAFWLLVVGLFGQGFLRDGLFGGSLFGDGLFHREIIQAKPAFAARRNISSSTAITSTLSIDEFV